MILKVHYTRFRNKNGSLSKTYASVDGKIEKSPAAQLYEGKAEYIVEDFCDDFPQSLTGASSNVAFSYGLPAKKFRQHPISIVVAGKEQPEKNVLSRTQDFFGYRKLPGILMLDHDPSPYGSYFSPSDLIEIVEEIFPPLSKSALIVRKSNSAGVHIKGKKKKKAAGFHIYIPVLNAADIPRIGKLLFDRLWLHGYGFIALSASGSLLVRSPIDAAVFSGERLDFVGKPVILGNDLVFDDYEPEVSDGGYFDTAKFNDLTDKDQRRVESLIEKAKSEMQVEAVAQREKWESNKIANMVESGVSEEKAVQIVRNMLDGEFKTIPGEFCLEFANGSFSVNEVLKNPQDFDEKSLADPIEGKAYGKSTAKFWWNNGKPIISSFAHGVQTTYFLQTKAQWQIDLDNRVQEFNKSYANVMTGTKNRIMRIEKGTGLHKDQDVVVFYERENLKKVFDNQQVKVGERVLKNGEVVDKLENPIIAWVYHEDSIAYRNGVVFLPGSKAPEGYFNTWSGFKVEPIPNLQLLKRLKSHLKQVVCKGNKKLFRYLVRWIAYSFQHPDRPIGTAIVLRGEKGSGKGSLGHFLRIIWGKHSLHISNSKHLVGSFNGHLADVCFLFADEAFFSGDKQHEGVLKAIITEPVITIERKGIDAIQQLNFLKILMATNADYAVPATSDERR